MSLWSIHRDVKYSFKNDAKKPALDTYYLPIKYIFRPLSFFPAAILIRLGISADQATILNGFVIICACVLFALGTVWATVLACLLYIFFYILDFVDGNIARYHKSTNFYGKFIDGLVDTLGGLIFIPISYAIINSGNVKTNNDLLVAAGFFASFAAVYGNLFRFRLDLFLHKVAAFNNSSVDSKVETKKKNNLSLIKLANRIYLNSIVFSPVLLPFFLLLNLGELFVFVYCGIHLFGTVSNILLALRRHKKNLKVSTRIKLNSAS